MQANKTGSSSSTKKWLIGCGIGCGVIIIILIILGVGGFFFVKNIIQGFKDTEAIMGTLTERYGRVKEYCPEPDGFVRSDRIEAFLSVRDTFSSDREKIAKTLTILSEGKREDDIEVKTPKNVIEKVKLGFGVIPQIGDFFKSRNQALLDVGMGMGEYYYIYVMAYYSWLGKPPEGGPDFQFVGDREDEDEWNKEETREARRYHMLRRIHRMILPMLRNQYKKLTEGDISGFTDKWRETLAAEIEAMESDRLRLPWQDGLPETLETSLEPFRSRLEASFSPMTNSLEIALEQK